MKFKIAFYFKILTIKETTFLRIKLNYFFLVFFYRYTPKLKDWVHVNAIESDAGGPATTWRAVSVVPNSKNLNSSKKSSFKVTQIDQDYLQDTSEITVERKTNFGTMMIGSCKSLPVTIENISPKDQVLLSAKFVNYQGNFELQHQIYPVVIPSKGKIVLEVNFK